MADPEERTSLTDAVKLGRRQTLVALRDHIARELEGNRCNKCQMSEMKSGDIAALALRLVQVMDAIEAIPEVKAGEVSELDAIRERNRAAASPHSSLPPKSQPRRQGGRAASGTRRPLP